MTYEQLGGDATGQAVGEMIFRSYAEAGQAPNPGMMVWAWRTCYDISQGMPPQQAIDKHEAELRAALGLPPLTPIVPPNGSAAVITRDYAGNMGGIRLSNLPDIGAGGSDPTLVLSWFYDRYPEDVRARIRDSYLQRPVPYLDVLLSWPDSRVYGFTPDHFVGTCRELVNAGFRPCVMFLSKYYDPNQDVAGCLANANPVIDQLLAAHLLSKGCVGWELGIEYNGRQWLTPLQVQQLVDAMAPRFVAAGVPLYVHFQQGYPHLDPKDPGGNFRDYWLAQRGKLTGLFHQRDLSWSRDDTKGRYEDILIRFSGAHAGGVPPDNGINGQPFDCIGLELTVEDQFARGMSEAEGDDWGRWVLQTPSQHGIRVMGSGNGQ